MRSLLASVVLGLSFVAACSVGDSGTGPGPDPGGDDVQTQPDANTTQTPVPRVDLSVDKPAVTTDLNVDNTIVVTATGAMGFAGDVTLTAAVSDSSGTALNGWTTLATSTITLATDGTGTADLKLKIPPNAPTLTGTIKISATSTAAASETSVAVTANPVVIVKISENGAGQCAYPAYPVNSPLRVKAGRMLKIVNNTTKLMTVHVDPGISGLPHESGTISNGQSYNGTLMSAGDAGNFYCHNGGNTIVDDGTGRPNLLVE